MLMNNLYYSLRMRASKEGSHISGAERLISSERLCKEMERLLNKAVSHRIGNPDEIHFTIEAIREDALFCESLPVSTVVTSDTRDSRERAAELLSLIGIPESSARRAFEDISKGASPDGKNMRGAMLIDIDSGKRIEPDPFRGVRVSRMDFEENAERSLESELERIGIKGSRVKEALALATKVIQAGTIAELCWSDNPDYTTGYIASKRYGYVRFANLKQEGDIKGGRAFFLKCAERELDNYISFYEKRAVLITGIPPGFKPCSFKEFRKRYED